MNIQSPGTYEKELNDILKLNGLPIIKIPTTPDSAKIFNSNKPDTTTQEGATALPPQPKQTISEDYVSMDESITQLEREIIPKYHSKDLGLTIYTPDDKGWPQGLFTHSELINGITRGRYTYTHTNKSITEDLLLSLLKNNKIILKDYWQMVDKDQFRRIRQGLVEERSPAGNRGSHIKKKPSYS